MQKITYYCPYCKNEALKIAENGLQCSNNHFISFIEGTNIPVFDCADEDTNEYTIEEAAKIHDNSLRWVFKTFGGDEESLRNSLLSRLHLKKNQSILITGVGAGNDLPQLAKMVGKNAMITAQDYSKQMLLSAVDRVNTIYNLSDYNIEFSVSDASNLPYANNSFDAVYHFGGINLFSDIKNGIKEMDRVAKDGGRVVFCDEGMAPCMKNSEYGKMLINNNYLYAYEAPLEYIPMNAKDVNLSWEVSNCFYVIDYTVSKTPLQIDFDVVHIGRRGGTIRKRYFGTLEGVDLELKEQLYKEAEKRGVSRVDFIEDILKRGLGN